LRLLTYGHNSEADFRVAASEVWLRLLTYGHNSEADFRVAVSEVWLRLLTYGHNVPCGRLELPYCLLLWRELLTNASPVGASWHRA